MSELKDQRTHAIIGAAMDVHRELGCGFLEPVYHEALLKEFEQRGIPVTNEKELPVFYKGEQLKSVYRVDFVCFDEVLVEIKALGRLSGAEESQVMNYLKASSSPIGLLINFGERSLRFKRFINSNLRTSA